MKFLYLRSQVMLLPHFGPVAAIQCLLRRISGVMTFSDFRLQAFARRRCGLQQDFILSPEGFTSMSMGVSSPALRPVL